MYVCMYVYVYVCVYVGIVTTLHGYPHAAKDPVTMPLDELSASITCREDIR